MCNTPLPVYLNPIEHPDRILKTRELKKPIDRCREYGILMQEDTELAHLLKQIDELLEQALVLGDKYDEDHKQENRESLWGNKALRCRLVLGMD